MKDNESLHYNDLLDLRNEFRKIYSNWHLFLKVLPVAFVLACIYIFSLPRYYNTDAALVPEIETNNASGMLGSLASSFGFDLSNMQTSDAITPLLYPDLMEDNGFASKVLSTHVQSLDGTIDTTYFAYLKSYQKKAWWKYPIAWVKNLLPKKSDPLSGSGANDGQYNPYRVSRLENDIMETARDKVEISLNKKTGVITISVTDQDQVICQMMADSVQQLLQVYITDYRTSKARSDMDYYEQLARQAKQEMKQAQQAYADYYDTHTGITMQSVRQQLNELETDLQLCQNAYTTINSQLQAARAKVQERTPAFTVIKGAAVPVQPAGPKRMFFVAGILFLSVIGTIIYILKDDLLKPFLKNTAETTENGSC